jgi:cell division protein FtsI (penicillin-binding protein 3)/stage V sporulation protein D (sporulation-specific penicillin-binding protein)
MIRQAQNRALIACSLLALCFTVFSARLVHLQVTMAQQYRTKAAEKHVTKEIIHTQRGLIQDVNGEILAQNEPIKTVIADASLIKDPAAVAEVLAARLELKHADVLQKLRMTRFSREENKEVPARYIVVKKKVPEDVARELLAELEGRKLLRGVRCEQDSERVYPNGSLLSHVIGALNTEGVPQEGIERSFDEQLRGEDGYRYLEKDRLGREMVAFRGIDRPGHDGANVRLTVDLGLQAIVEDELDAAVKQYRPHMATVVLMRPATGEILAMANRPHFNLNQKKDVPLEHRKNRAIVDQVEPGSTFKIVPVGAALAQKVVRPETMIFCENGSYRYGGRSLRDAHPMADLSISDILVKSSNIGSAKLAIQVGDQKFYEYVRRFGFGERTGVNLPGEISGLVRPPHTWSKISITRIPMGHEVCVTPLQLVTAMSVVANGGALMTPQIVREVVDHNGRVTSYPPVEVRRVIPESVAATVRDALVDVVSKRGTAALAHVPGYKVAGKTGTAQRVALKGGYEPGKYVASFAGFMPADQPEFAAVVLLDDPKTKPHAYYGGLVAAPIFSRIAERAARYLNLVPTPEAPAEGVVAAAKAAPKATHR